MVGFDIVSIEYGGKFAGLESYGSRLICRKIAEEALSRLRDGKCLCRIGGSRKMGYRGITRS